MSNRRIFRGFQIHHSDTAVPADLDLSRLYENDEHGARVLEISLSNLDGEISRYADAFNDDDTTALEGFTVSGGSNRQIVENTYNTIVKATTVMLETLVKLAKWCEDNTGINNDYLIKLLAELRYHSNQYPEGKPLTLTPDEAQYFTIHNRGFSINEVLCTYIVLLRQMTKSYKQYQILDSIAIGNPADTDLDNPDIFFTVENKEHTEHNNGIIYYGPYLPLGYRLICSSKTVNGRNRHKISVVKTKYEISNEKKVITLTKSDIETLITTIEKINSASIDTTIYVRALADKAKQTVDTFNIPSVKNLSLEDMKLIIQQLRYITATVREPLMSLTVMSQSTLKRLLILLAKHIEQEK